MLREGRITPPLLDTPEKRGIMPQKNMRATPKAQKHQSISGPRINTHLKAYQILNKMQGGRSDTQAQMLMHNLIGGPIPEMEGFFYSLEDDHSPTGSTRHSPDNETWFKKVEKVIGGQKMKVWEQEK